MCHFILGSQGLQGNPGPDGTPGPRGPQGNIGNIFNIKLVSYTDPHDNERPHELDMSHSHSITCYTKL